MAGGRLPFFSAMAEGRIARAYLEPQPDDAVPRFAYEEHLAELARDPPQWPESTRRISQLRLTVEYRRDRAAPHAATGRLHIDIVDYPGEWLLDLPLLELDFAEWSLPGARRRARPAARAERRRDWLEFVAALDPEPGRRAGALTGAKLFTRYLQAARAPDPELIAPGPGRFLLPGDLAGSPLLTFFPLPPRASAAYSAAASARCWRAGSRATRRHVVEPFFRDHFARLDRQIVLVDALSAVNAGAAALADLQRTWGRARLLPAGRQHLAVEPPGAAASTACCSPPPRPTTCTTPATTGWRRSCAARRQGHRAGRICRRGGEGDGAGRDQGHARGRGPIGPAAPALHRRRAAARRARGRKVFDGTAEAAVFPGDLPEDPTSLLAQPAAAPVAADDACISSASGRRA